MKIDELIQNHAQETLDSLFILKPENITYVMVLNPPCISFNHKKKPLLFSKNGYGRSTARILCSCVELNRDEVKKSLKETLHGKMGVKSP
jgi:hypothetical protein